MKVDYNNLVPGSVDVFAMSAALPLPQYGGGPDLGPAWPVLPPTAPEEIDAWMPIEGEMAGPVVGTDGLDPAGATAASVELLDPQWGVDGVMADAVLAKMALGGYADEMAPWGAGLELGEAALPTVGEDMATESVLATSVDFAAPIIEAPEMDVDFDGPGLPAPSLEIDDGLGDFDAASRLEHDETLGTTWSSEPEVFFLNGSEVDAVED